MNACLVISHYNAWPTDQLVSLLDQTRRMDAGLRFHTRVVVNQAAHKPLLLPPRFSGLEVYYKPNSGYNIGAWDLGWRVGQSYRYYLFLQEECVIRADGWLAAYVDALSDPEVGLVGESINSWSAERRAKYPICTFLGFPPQVDAFVEQVMAPVRAAGIDPGDDDSHLQSLVLATRREVLERIGGFRSECASYIDAVGSEVLISKSVAAAGWTFRQLGARKFEKISHPQWDRSPFRRGMEAVFDWCVPKDLRRATYLVMHALLRRAGIRP